MARAKRMPRKELAELVEAWRKVLLPEWRVVLMHSLPEGNDGDCWAVCETADDYQRLRVHFTDDLLNRGPREIEITIVHELLHALTRPWRKLIDDVEEDIAAGKHKLLHDFQSHEEEQLVDRLSYVIVCQTHNAEPFGTVEGDVTTG
jgi:hypothetical protein